MPMTMMPSMQHAMNPYQLDRNMVRAFNEMFHDELRMARVACPYWRSVSGDSLSFAEERREIQNTSDKFCVCLDVSAFRPEEIKVDLSGNELMVEGNQEEKRDQWGSISRSFRRKYLLPDDTNVDSLRCCLSEMGCLNIECSKKSGNKGGMQPKAIAISREP